jgi:hypothetical protein
MNYMKFVVAALMLACWPRADIRAREAQDGVLWHFTAGG